ncbi:decapping enzyme complex catalytic subunit DCP2 [Aspergillus luchuensis]|uniref:Decapping enzyme Dcp2 n=1 Tax=Aspergillus kawachii TaxID=1069201 RepID=A0A146EYJ5_ASPKA|nr:mRNA-decapping enzyme subunit 2 [Aspergillus luchuensis]BCR99604.1 mRNA-decapping enzyme subunit 2 [Aspergillus luchuensis]BCS11898.1 mRNA-decapping enzyme subunit 2 [Aspergillus luchuensis]GAT19134.1 decapping enzyme Dcp2 [Aspergillus luchuensis]
MTETKMQLEDWLDDLCVRFIINLPREELESVERICFQVEEAQWFYEDFIRPLDPALPSLSLKAFALRIFQHCPLMSQWSHYHHITAFSEFLAYKTRVPVRGAIMLNDDMDEVVLVKGWKKGANWSFPRGKINKDEKDIDCAIREVYEETGFDVREAGLVQDEKDVKFIEITMREQHMRLYVFRGVPQDAHFEPRTRKEISKIEWYKLSELPTLKKSKQQDQGFAVANANKFYMVAPFMHPLKKWIAQQKRLEGKTPGGPKLPMQNDMSIDEASHAVHSFTPNQAAAEMATPSDLPELASTQDASAHLKRLLNINNLVPSGNTSPIIHAPVSGPSASKSNALLELLRTGSSRESLPQANIPEQQSMPAPLPGSVPPVSRPYPAMGFFPGFPQQGPHVGVPPSLPSYPQPNHGPVPHLPASIANAMPHGQLNQRPLSAAPPGPSGSVHGTFPPQQSLASHFHKDTGSLAELAPAPQSQAAPAPYHRTGDPQFSQSGHPSQALGATVPPARNLPPPKLTSHSLALLNVFKDDSTKTPKTPKANLVSHTGPAQASERRPSQHQDHLLNLLRGSPAPAVSGPAELSGQSVSPARKQVLQRPRGDHSPARRSSPAANPWTSSPASGPTMHTSQPGAQKPSRKAQNGPNRKGLRSEQASAVTAPITILARPQAAKEQPPARASPQTSRPPSQPRGPKPSSPEPPKPFQPQILRRSDNPNAMNLLPIRTALNESQNQQAAARSTESPRHSQPQPSFDRRPSQTVAQKEMLLSLFGKTSVSPNISPAELGASVPKPSQPSSVVSPLSPVNLPAVPNVGQTPHEMEDSQVSNANKVSSPVNKAFLLGFLEGVAKGHK